MRVLALLIALVAVCAGLAQTSQGHALLAAAGLYERPASYTELAFTTPGDLPSSLPAPRSPISVSFSIHNDSGTARAYQWSIVLTNVVPTKASQSHVTASGTLTTPAQGRATVTKSVATTCAGGRLQVLVRLASPAESTDFWVTCPASSAGSK